MSLEWLDAFLISGLFFVVMVIGSFYEGDPDWFLAIFTVPFVVIGIGLIVFFLRQLLVTTGIGPTLASRIAEDRRVHGPYPNVEALGRVRGIGAKTVERLRPYLRVGPGTGSAKAAKR